MSILGLAASIQAGLAVDKDKEKARFAPPDIDAVETKQTADGLTIAAIPYATETMAKSAFGKVNPYEHGMLPVLFLIRNASKETLRLQGLKVEYIDRNRERIEATPASEVKYSRGPRRPSMTPSPIPGVRLGGRKNPLAAEEIEMRGWSAKMLPPGEAAFGFFYFQTGHRTGSRLYVTGIQRAATGQELIYFDVPLD